MGQGSERQGRILVVDDSELMLEQAAAALRSAGYDVVTTSKTVGASRHLAGSDLAIIDFHMPGFDGADLVQSMREAMRQANKHCLLYLYTSDEAVAGNFRKLGFDGCLLNKGDMRDLVAQVGAVFRLLHMRGIAGRVRKALEK
ncbi:MAG TPA: response regulator [Polyangiaceae bacterium]|nr:response regulator [Polyangiaceae bacterium]